MNRALPLLSSLLLLLWLPGCSAVQGFSALIGPPPAPSSHMRQSVLDRLAPAVRKDFEQLTGSQPAPQPALSPAELLAKQWRERLASNTMSGASSKAAEADDVKWRAADQEIRSAQTLWMRLGPVPPEVAGPLNERFQRACRRFYEQRRRAS